MKYNARIHIHPQSPFYPHLEAEIERKIFLTDKFPATCIINWYWHTQNPGSPIKVVYERSRLDIVPESRDAYTALYLQGVEWADCEAYSMSQSRGLKGELEYTSKPELVNLKEELPDYYASAEQLWRDHFNRSFIIEQGDRSVEVNIADNSYRTQVYRVEDYGSLAKTIQRMFTHAQRGAFR